VLKSVSELRFIIEVDYFFRATLYYEVQISTKHRLLYDHSTSVSNFISCIVLLCYCGYYSAFMFYVIMCTFLFRCAFAA